MTIKIKIFSRIGMLFLCTALVLLVVQSRQFHGTGTAHQLAYPLLPFLLLAVLYIVTSQMMAVTVQKLHSTISDYRKQLDDSNASLEETTRNLEERVERRTFEIAVANASLNREIAERIQAETATEKIKRRMELILESAGEGIFGLDADGKVSFVNKAASTMLGWAPEDLTGKPHHDLVHHSHADGTPYPVDECPIHQAYRDGKVHIGSNELFWTKSGKGFAVEYVSTPIVENNHLAGAVVVFRNLTASRENIPLQSGANDD